MIWDIENIKFHNASRENGGKRKKEMKEERNKGKINTAMKRV